MKPYTYLDFLAYMGVGNAHPGGLQLTKRILDKITITPTTNILDVGCGTGVTAAYISEHYGCNVTAVDIHPEMIKKARRRFEDAQLDIQLKNANAEQLPFEDNAFDVVLTESVTAFTAISTSLKEYSRLLTDDGILLAIEMTAENDLTSEDKQNIQNLYGMNDILTEPQWLTALNHSGFNSIEVIDSGNAVQHMADQEETNEEYNPIFEPSEDLDSGIYSIWAEHELLMLKYQTLIGHRVFRAHKK